MKLHNRLWKAEGEELAKLLLLHGMGGTGGLWRPVAASMEKDTSILAPDQRGHGQSQITHAAGTRVVPRYTPLDYGRDIVETLESMDFHPCWVVGHSMGVRTACAFHHLRPEWVQGLVLVDLGLSGPAGGGLGDELASFLRILPMHFQSREAARNFMNEKCPDPAMAQYLMAVSVATPEGGLTFPFDRSALIQTIEASRDTSVREWVREAGERKTPVLILRGAKSLVWSHEDLLKEKEHFSDLPSVVLEEMQGTGHGLPFEKRIEFVARLRRFMELEVKAK